MAGWLVDGSPLFSCGVVLNDYFIFIKTHRYYSRFMTFMIVNDDVLRDTPGKMLRRVSSGPNILVRWNNIEFFCHKFR